MAFAPGTYNATGFSSSEAACSCFANLVAKRKTWQFQNDLRAFLDYLYVVDDPYVNDSCKCFTVPVMDDVDALPVIDCRDTKLRSGRCCGATARRADLTDHGAYCLDLAFGCDSACGDNGSMYRSKISTAVETLTRAYVKSVILGMKSAVDAKVEVISDSSKGVGANPVVDFFSDGGKVYDATVDTGLTFDMIMQIQAEMAMANGMADSGILVVLPPTTYSQFLTSMQKLGMISYDSISGVFRDRFSRTSYVPGNDFIKFMTINGNWFFGQPKSQKIDKSGTMSHAPGVVAYVIAYHGLGMYYKKPANVYGNYEPTLRAINSDIASSVVNSDILAPALVDVSMTRNDTRIGTVVRMEASFGIVRMRPASVAKIIVKV